jgi:nucleoside-diphosphate-sugar epimerase
MLGGSVVVTGAAGGLGRYLAERFGALRLTRSDDAGLGAGARYDVVVHCASNASKDVPASALYRYWADNVSLTERLVDACRGTFVLLSSVSVYPLDDARVWREDDDFPAELAPNLHGLTKLVSEAIVREHVERSLVLRPGSLLGPYSRRNTTYRVLAGEPSPLAPQSLFNYIHYRHVGDFIERAVAVGATGVFNVAAGDRVELAEVCREAGVTPAFGALDYRVPQVDTHRARSLLPTLPERSMDVVREEIERLRPR